MKTLTLCFLFCTTSMLAMIENLDFNSSLKISNSITNKSMYSAIEVAENNCFETCKMVIAPTITSFSPTSGLIGTTITILGSDFSETPSNNIVQLNGTMALVTSASTTSLTVIVPVGATTGSVNVSVDGFSVISSSVFTVLASSNCNGISKNNAKNWYFGNRAAIKFENNVPVALTDNAMSQVEGVATMSDANGNLLFYTNGITIYNHNHQTMLNGTGLTSHSSNTQAAFIVPFPENPDKYYVITPDPYYYSIVDMTLDNGNGAVQADAKNILLSSERSEKVAGLLASNQTDIWLITYGAGPMRFNVFKITAAGITTIPVVSQFTTASGYYGYMKISPDGTKIAMANFSQSFHLYDFDAATGVVSNQVVIPISIGGFGSYGIEFSPNNNLVYVADHRGQNKVFQYDITLATPALISGSVVPLTTNTVALGGIQLGPDNKIYVARENNGFLGVINNPDLMGEACDYVAEGVFLAGKTSNLGLPGFVASSLVQNQPYIASFLPTSGEIGQTVTIFGIDFSAIINNNIVKFNGIEATVLEATSTSLTVIIPNEATTGKISIAVGCTIVATSDDFTITSLHIDEVQKGSMIIYPNPTTGVITINTDLLLENSTLSVFDAQGKTVYYNSDVDVKKPISLEKLKSGIYFLKLECKDVNYTTKLIKL